MLSASTAAAQDAAGSTVANDPVATGSADAPDAADSATAPEKPARVRGQVPYIYERNGNNTQGSAWIEAESAYGTREISWAGSKGFEQVIRGRYAITNWLTAEAQLGALVDTSKGELVGFSPQAELDFGALNQKDHYINMTVGVGYRYDYLRRNLPRLRLTLSHDFGLVDWRLWAMTEFPLNKGLAADAGEEDEEGGGGERVDAVVGTALSFRLAEWSRLGAELVIEDLEGFWEKEENEGGARFVTGPTVWFALGDHWELKLNGAAVVQLTNSIPIGATTARPQTGFLGRLAVAYVF